MRIIVCNMHMLCLSRRAQGCEPGFTIMELLIVIVVIAVLAAISVVVYRGVQERDKEAAIISDLSNFSKQAELYRVENDGYPNVTEAVLSNVGFRVNQSAYPSDLIWNFDYCTNSSDPGLQYILFAHSSPLKGFFVSSSNSSPREMSLSQPCDSGNPLPCYSGHPDSAADRAGLEGIDAGRSGHRDGVWDSWLK